MASIRCGKCAETHASVDAVKACHAGNLFTCHWLVEIPFRWVTDEETGEVFDVEAHTRDCGAEAIATERGWTCAAGHEHVTAEARRNEGWDYAEEYGEAADLALAGVEPRTMSGHIVTSPSDFQRVA